jgi:hypothetical protein
MLSLCFVSRQGFPFRISELILKGKATNEGSREWEPGQEVKWNCDAPIEMSASGGQ